MTRRSLGFDPMSDGIPVIDFGPWSNRPTNASEADKTRVSTELLRAFTTIGFVILTNHGVRGDQGERGVTAQAFAASKEFFALRRDVKMKCAYRSNASNRGYIAMGQEKLDANLPDLKETFDIGYEDDVDYQNPWPEPGTVFCESFKKAMLDYFAEYDRLHLNILLALARGMNLEDDYFTPLCNGNHQNLRLLHYPECDREAVKNTPRGGLHTDYGTITLLSQQHVGGLVAQQLDATWISVPPIPGSVVVNVGEMLQRWSNDVLRATPHQVLEEDPFATRGSKRLERVPERYSIAFFCNANKDTSLDCLPLCHGPDRPPKYEPMNAFEYLTLRLASTIPVKPPDE